MEPDEQPKSRTGSVLRELVETILFTLLIYILIRTFLFENYRVVGHSMDPTLADGQFLVVNKLGYRLHEPQRGDIVVFRDARNSERKLIKRIIGLPYEAVEIRQGQIFINERLLDESYIENAIPYSARLTLLAEGEYYVLGDNRNNSSDSRNWGALPRENIVGKAWLSYWPIQRWGLVPHAIYNNVP